MRRSLLVLAVGLLLVAPSAWAQVAFDATANASADTDNDETITWTHTTSGADRCLIVGLTIGNTTLPTVVTANGRAMTLVTSQELTDGELSILYRLEAPDLGSNTLIITSGVLTPWKIAGSVSFTGADQTNCVSASNQATGTSAAPSVGVTSATTEIVVANVTSFGGVSWTIGTGETERWDYSRSGGPGTLSGGGYTQPGAAGTVTIAPTQSGSQEWGIVAVSVKAVGGAAAVAATQMLLGVGP